VISTRDIYIEYIIEYNFFFKKPLLISTNMRLCPYKANYNDYKSYYKNQSGSGLPVFVGRNKQVGYGFGSLLGSLFRSVAPLVKSAVVKSARVAGRHALRAGKDVLTDVLSGKNVKQSLKRRSLQTLQHLPDAILGSEQIPAEMAPVKRRRKGVPIKRGKGRGKRKRDIYD
jgi:hypothetical protein